MVRLFDFPSALRWVSTCGYMDEERCRGRDREGSERSRARESESEASRPAAVSIDQCFSTTLYKTTRSQHDNTICIV
jgi:hypothetical protein